jgi:hypothetical protein
MEDHPEKTETIDDNDDIDFEDNEDEDQIIDDEEESDEITPSEAAFERGEKDAESLEEKEDEKETK